MLEGAGFAASTPTGTLAQWHGDGKSSWKSSWKPSASPAVAGQGSWVRGDDGAGA